MKPTLALNIITPEAVFFSGEAGMVTAPGTMGEFGVLPGHAPLIATLKPGIVKADHASGTQRIAILDGVAEVTQDRCTILAEVAKSLNDISASEAAAELQAAQDAFESAHTEELKARARAAVALAELVAQAV